ncbi:MAG: hypothetical protein MJ211_06715 [Bacteroidales bacterium]|nr:hypothetical protein [Bacteroidales bacterium]
MANRLIGRDSELKELQKYYKKILKNNISQIILISGISNEENNALLKTFIENKKNIVLFDCLTQNINNSILDIYERPIDANNPLIWYINNAYILEENDFDTIANFAKSYKLIILLNVKSKDLDSIKLNVDKEKVELNKIILTTNNIEEEADKLIAEYHQIKEKYEIEDEYKESILIKALGCYQNLLKSSIDQLSISRKEAETIYLLGDFYEENRNFPKANKFLSDALSKFKKLKDDFYIGLSYFKLGESTDFIDEIQKEIKFKNYIKALKYLTPEKYLSNRIEVLFRIQHVCLILGNDNKKYLKEIINLTKNNPKEYFKDLFNACNDIYNSYLRSDDYDKAIAILGYMKKFVPIYGSSYEKSKLLQYESDYYAFKFDFEQADKIRLDYINYRKQEIEEEKDSDKIKEQEYNQRLGYLYQFESEYYINHNNYWVAIQYINLSIEHFKKSGYVTFIMSVMKSKKDLLIKTCHYELALQALNEYVRIFEESNGNKKYSLIEDDMLNTNHKIDIEYAEIYYKLGDYQKSLFYYKKYYEEFIKKDDYGYYESFYEQYANCLEKSNYLNYKEIASYYIKASEYNGEQESYWEELDDLKKATVIYYKNNDKYNADLTMKKLREKAGFNCKKYADTTHIEEVGEAEYLAGNYEKCIDSFMEIMQTCLNEDICSRNFISDVYNLLGKCLLSDKSKYDIELTYHGKTQKIYEFAIDYLKESIKLYEKHGDTLYYEYAIVPLFRLYLYKNINCEEIFNITNEYIQANLEYKKYSFASYYLSLMYIYQARYYYFYKKDNKRADFAFKKTLQCIKNIERKNLKSIRYAEVCNYLFDINKVDEAMKYSFCIIDKEHMAEDLQDKLKQQYKLMKFE